MTTTAQFSQGAQVRYTDNEPNNPLRRGVVEGQVFDVQSTSGGNFRYRIRTDTPAPQGGGNIEVLVYSHEGKLERRFAVYEMVADTYKDWGRNQCRGYVPTTRQLPIIAAVRNAVEVAELYYTDQVYAHCVNLLQPTPEQLAVAKETVEGGEFGMDLFYAREYIDAQRKFAWEDSVMPRIKALVGKPLGTMLVNRVRLSCCVLREIAADGTFKLTAKKGRSPVELTMATAAQFVYAINEAASLSYRKTDFDRLAA